MTNSRSNTPKRTEGTDMLPYDVVHILLTPAADRDAHIAIGQSTRGLIQATRPELIDKNIDLADK